MLYIQEAAVV